MGTKSICSILEWLNTMKDNFPGVFYFFGTKI